MLDQFYYDYYFNNIVNSMKTLKNSPEKLVSLSDGIAGSLLILSTFSKYEYQRERSITIIEELLNLLNDISIPAINPSLWGGITGLNLSLKLCQNFQNIFQLSDTIIQLDDYIKRTVIFLEKKNQFDISSYDMMYGICGRLVYMLQNDKQVFWSEIIYAHKLLTQIVTSDILEKIDSMGIAHGISGMLGTFIKCQEAGIESMYYIDVLLDFLLKKSISIYPFMYWKTSSDETLLEMNYSWCRGLSGIYSTIIKAYQLKKSSNEFLFQKQYKKSLIYLLNHKEFIQRHYSLFCHGISGILYDIFLLDSDIEYNAILKVLYDILTQNINEVDFTKSQDLSLLNGLGGILLVDFAISKNIRIPKDYIFLKG
ncbi:hypothetical protein KG091_00200 [Carnobacteriaceae bacterium zg-ZUI78]|nr:hypothetical protein [Carnobacteriaceae bacterium zg-ZUI78]